MLDAPSVRRVLLEHEPEAIVHQATALASAKFSRNMDKVTATTSALRTKGTDALLAAAREVGARRFVHLDDAAAATVLALEHDGPAIYNIVDDDPAPVRDWLPVLAQSLGAKPPRHIPTWLAWLLAGEPVTVLSTEARGASNAKAKRELGWTPRYPTWRTGFREVYSALAIADRPTPEPTSRTSHSSR